MLLDKLKQSHKHPAHLSSAIQFSYPEVSESFLAFLQKHKEAIEIKASDRMIIGNDYFRGHYPGSHAKMFAREALWLKLKDALALLDTHFGFYLFDAFRTIETQTALFKEFIEIVHKQHPTWSHDAVTNEALNYVSHPSNTDRFPHPLHNTGGAIDLAIIDLNTGLALDMGTDIDTISEVSHTHYFEQEPVSNSDWDEERWQCIRQNRRLLFNVMAQVGFVNFPNEWWHYDLGNGHWAEVLNQSSAYDSIEPTVNKMIASYG